MALDSIGLPTAEPLKISMLKRIENSETRYFPLVIFDTDDYNDYLINFDTWYDCSNKTQLVYRSHGYSSSDYVKVNILAEDYSESPFVVLLVRERNLSVGNRSGVCSGDYYVSSFYSTDIRGYKRFKFTQVSGSASVMAYVV